MDHQSRQFVMTTETHVPTIGTVVFVVVVVLVLVVVDAAAAAAVAAASEGPQRQGHGSCWYVCVTHSLWFTPLLFFSTFFREKSLIRHHFVLSYLLFYCPRKETTCPIGFLGQFYLRKVTCPQSADGVFISKNAFIDDIQIVKIKIHNYAPNKSCISESI